MTLDQLTIGQEGRVEQLDASCGSAARLMEMGLVPGTAVRVVRVAPLGDPIDILVRGYHLSLRRSEARGVTVGRVDTAGAAT
ncbi:MAG: ferrous iron transport protein A [Phycisphaerales bacterium]|nr:ferrous iron transport protein A [Phycisphaerales bacterium]